MITFVKLGGSLITDKRGENAFRSEAAARVAGELARALADRPTLQLLIGHGSGSFGHVAARKYGTMAGVRTPDQWRGFAEVAAAAAELNHLMTRCLIDAGIPVWRIQPSASAHCKDGVIANMAVEPVHAALEHGLVPLVYGDVALDDVRGGTIISTETIFFYLARHVPVSRIFLLGEVDGVLDDHQTVIPKITTETLPQIEGLLGGSHGTDVTGGMETKVRDMVSLAQVVPGLQIRIFNGTRPALLYRALVEEESPGTLITAY